MKTKLVIFGLTGDLGTRKLLPALNNLLKGEEVSINDLEIIGISRREVNVADVIKKSLTKREAENSGLNKITHFHQMNLADLDDYITLKNYLNIAKNDQALFYLSVPPNSAAQISELLGKAGLNQSNMKIIFEKPFGIDLKSAENFLTKTHEYFAEKQILRVDHYLAKESVRKLHAVFENNDILRELRDQKQIEKIEIVAGEKIDIQGRGIFYEQTGALRDFVQSHLASVLATIFAEENKDFRAARSQVLKQIMPIFDPQTQAIRAQYNGYKEEINEPKTSIETFAKIKLFSANLKWQNVPIYLISGKALKAKTSQLRICFNEKRNGCLTLDMAEIAGQKEPYEQVLLDAINNRTDYFISEDEMINSWRIFDPVLKYWEFSGEDGLNYYRKDSDWQKM